MALLIGDLCAIREQCGPVEARVVVHLVGYSNPRLFGRSYPYSKGTVTANSEVPDTPKLEAFRPQAEEVLP